MAENQQVKDRIFCYLRAKNLSKAEFERRSHLSNGYLNSMKKGFGIEKLENVLRAFPDISREWLLSGEGEMLKSPSASSVQQTGNNNITQSGNNSGNASISDPSVIGKAMDEISRLTSVLTDSLETKDGQIKEKDGQINALIGIIQKMQDTKDE